MNLLDRAFIKAYAKTNSSAAAHSEVMTSAAKPPATDQTALPAPIEQECDIKGVRYRIQTPAARAAAIPLPHADFPQSADYFHPIQSGRDPSTSGTIPQPPAARPASETRQPHVQVVESAVDRHVVWTGLAGMESLAEPDSSWLTVTSNWLPSHGHPIDYIQPSTTERGMSWTENAVPPADLELELERLRFESAHEVATEALAKADREPLSADPSVPEKAGSEPRDEAPPSRSMDIRPAWEVDEFDWPEICQRLDQAIDRQLTESGQELVAASRDGLRVLEVTGTRRGEGRTTMALCIARSAAQAGARVALLDADLAHPSMATQLGVDAPACWTDAVGQTTDLEAVMVRSLGDGLTLIPARAKRGNRISLSDAQVSDVIGQLSEHFDLIVVDSPPTTNEPLFDSGDRCPIDAAIVVRDVRSGGWQKTMDIVGQLQSSGIRAVGVAENFG